MSCRRCSSDGLKTFGGELAIHFPGLEGLDKPIVLAFPKLMTCLNCGFVEFDLLDEQIEQLKNGDRPAQTLGASKP